MFYKIMEENMAKTQNETLLNFLVTGRRLTTRMARSWGIQNPRARIHELRVEGFRIFTNRRRDPKTGAVKYHYRLG